LRGLERGGVHLLPEGRPLTLGRGEDAARCQGPWRGGLGRGGDRSAASDEASDEPFLDVGPWAECVLGSLEPGEDLGVQA
jgi:hypothetical protein